MHHSEVHNHAFILIIGSLDTCIHIRAKRRNKETNSKHTAVSGADHDRADLPLVDIDTIKINTDTGYKIYKQEINTVYLFMTQNLMANVT